MATLLGIARDLAGSIPGRLLPIFTDLFDFLGRYSSHSRVVFTVTTCLHDMFFFQNRPLEESPHHRVELSRRSRF
jgi:hypothetical protein